jgi:hypothetical protein
MCFQAVWWKLATFLGGRPTVLMLCLDSTALILKGFWRQDMKAIAVGWLTSGVG